MSVIHLKNLTKDYGNHNGIFDVSFDVNQGEVVAFLGPNGSGKTTTIRHLMGFIQADDGVVSILDKDCFHQREDVQKSLGYLPGEITLIDDMKAIEFIKFIAHMKNIKDFSKAERLVQFFELDANIKVKKMSKGMKQKVGLVIAFMSDACILILDEPTSGLDPLMQSKFVELINKVKSEGKTVLMSSHIFEEVEHTCDRVIMIKDGHIIADESMIQLKNNRHKCYEIIFETEEEAMMFSKGYECQRDKNKVILMNNNIKHIIKDLSQYEIIDISSSVQSLEELFLHYYGGQHD